jgi:ribonucleotide monophosphatase NagD (HAD superfamily)
MGLKVGNCYMIGDNPSSDIKGGNDMNWTTILVKTGIYSEGKIDS